MTPWVALLAVPLALAGCQRIDATSDALFQRMLEQPRADIWEENEAFPDRRVMRQPPEGTVPHSQPVGEPLLIRGVKGGTYADRIQVQVTRRLLEIGRDRFDVFCAACHGILGDGNSPVAQNMQLRRPPSLVDPRVRAFPPGRVYQVVREGYGLMPPYSIELSVEESWAVVAYLRALQLSQYARVDELPPVVRDEVTPRLEQREERK